MLDFEIMRQNRIRTRLAKDREDALWKIERLLDERRELRYELEDNDYNHDPFELNALNERMDEVTYEIMELERIMDYEEGDYYDC